MWFQSLASPKSAEPVSQFEPKGQQAALEFPVCQFQGQGAGEYFLTRLGQPFVLFKPSTDLDEPTHVGEGNLLYSVHPFKC